jgi:hypothetical protein
LEETPDVGGTGDVGWEVLEGGGCEGDGEVLGEERKILQDAEGVSEETDIGS